jgi:hypothetical protein
VVQCRFLLPVKESRGNVPKVSTLTEIEAAIKLLPVSQFEELARWIDARRGHATGALMAGKDVRDCCVDGSPWEDSAEAMRVWAAWSDSLEPVFTGEELKEFEASLLQMRGEQKGRAPEFQARIEQLFR